MNERIALYSSTLYSAACEENCAKEVYESLNAVKDALENNSEYARIVSSANLELAEREKLLDDAFGGRVHAYVVNFMKLLAKRRVFDIFVPVAAEYEKMYFADNRIERATIVTAFELDEAKKRDIVAKIAAAENKEIIPLFKVKPDIIAGVVIETEGSSIDASVSGKLDAIRRYISKN